MEQRDGQGFLEAALGRPFLERVGRYAARIPDRWQVAAFAAALGGLLLIPYLGAVGLWDPWETHYGEVAPDDDRTATTTCTRSGRAPGSSPSRR